MCVLSNTFSSIKKARDVYGRGSIEPAVKHGCLYRMMLLWGDTAIQKSKGFVVAVHSNQHCSTQYFGRMHHSSVQSKRLPAQTSEKEMCAVAFISAAQAGPEQFNLVIDEHRLWVPPFLISWNKS